MDTVQKLFDIGADLAAVSNKGWTGLHCAAHLGHEQVLEFLLKHMRSDLVDHRDKRGWTALHLAAEHGSSAGVRLLHQVSVKPTQERFLQCTQTTGQSWHGQEIVLFAHQGNQSLTVRVGNSGLSYEHNKRQGTYPLHRGDALHAAILRDTCCVVQASAGLDSQSQEGWTPLHLATKQQQLQVVECLLKAGANAGLTDSNGCTPLHYAVQLADMALFNQLYPHAAVWGAKQKDAKGD